MKATNKIKCACAYCGAPVLRTPSEIDRVRNCFCNRACKEQHQTKYTLAAYSYISQNLGVKSLQTMARQINSTVSVLRHRIPAIKKQAI